MRTGSTRGVFARLAIAATMALALGSLPAVAGPRLDAKPVTEVPAKPEPPPCLLPQGEPISANKIMQDLAAGRSMDIQGRIIDGSLDADAIATASDERRASLRVVTGRLRLDSCRVNGRVSLPHSVLTQEVVITCSEVIGDVDLSDSDVRGSLTLDRSKIVGDVRLARATIGRDVSLKGTRLEGSLDMPGGRAQNLFLGRAEIRRDVEMSRAVVQMLDLSSAHVNGSVKLEDVLVITSIAAHGAKIDRSITFDSVRVVGIMDLNELVPAGGITASNLTVEGNLMFSIAGDAPITLQDVAVGANLVMVDGLFGEVNIQRLRVRGGSEMQGCRFTRRLIIGDTDFGGTFNASEARFERETEFRKVRFAGEDPMAGALFASAPVLVDTVLPIAPTLMGDEGEPSDEGDDDGDDGEEGGQQPGPGS